MASGVGVDDGCDVRIWEFNGLVSLCDEAFFSPKYGYLLFHKEVWSWVGWNMVY